MKNALVLSGGGFKGAFQVGALRELRRRGITFDYVTGISTGALQGLLVAMDAYDELGRLWQRVADEGPGVIYTSDLLEQNGGVASISFKKVYQLLAPKLSVKLIWQLLSEKGRKAQLAELVGRVNAIEAFADNSPLLALLEELIDTRPIVIPFQCGAVSLHDGSYYCRGDEDFSQAGEFARFVKASASMPMVWPSTDVISRQGGTLLDLVDGGVRNISPLGDAISYINAQDESDSWRIILINCESGHLGKAEPDKWSLLHTAERSLDILLSEVFQGDIDQFLTMNRLALQAHQQGVTLRLNNGRPLRYFESLIIEPSLPVGGTLDASSKSIYARIEHGEERALEILSVKATDPYWSPQ
ncbi:patatin-like phospholipase family protein [Fibrella sp. ES10-3-2-2]|nr:hypothetical protein A6C57_00410 [Fibrella sp. ES10-3-2-2]